MQTQLEPTKKSHRILFAIIIILLTAGAIGGGVYYVLGQQIKKQDKLIEDLQKKETTTKTEEKKVETSTTQTPVADTAPIIAWSSAGEFATAEKSEITQKIIEPYLYYEKLAGNKIVSMLFIEIPVGNKGPQEYSYTVHTISAKGYNGGWVFGENDKINYWKPVCGVSGPAA